MRRGALVLAVVLLVGGCTRQVPKHFTHEVLNRMTMPCWLPLRQNTSHGATP